MKRIQRKHTGEMMRMSKDGFWRPLLTVPFDISFYQAIVWGLVGLSFVNNVIALTFGLGSDYITYVSGGLVGLAGIVGVIGIYKSITAK